MDTKLASQAVKDVACDALIVGATRVGKGQEKTPLFSAYAQEVDQLLDGLLTSMYANDEFKGNAGETAQIYTMGKLAARRVIVAGLGAQEKLQSRAFRHASGVAVRFAQSNGARQVALALGEQEQGPGAAQALQAVVEGALLGAYGFKKYQTTRDNGSGVEKLLFLSTDAQSETQQEALRRGIIMAEGANFARDLINEQPAVLTPSELARRAYEMARQFDLECTILDRPQMEELGMGGLLGVAKGSVEPPKFITLS
jgi:leucyl aminopeptidase